MRYADLLLEAGAIPATLYHGTLKTAIPIIQAHGLQPRAGKLWRGQPLVFAADNDHRRKLLAVLLQQIGHALGKPMAQITQADVMQLGSIAVITDTTPFQRARGKGRPLPFLELGDYYAERAVPVNQFMEDAAMAQFLAAQFRIWHRLVQNGEV